MNLNNSLCLLKPSFQQRHYNLFVRLFSQARNLSSQLLNNGNLENAIVTFSLHTIIDTNKSVAKLLLRPNMVLSQSLALLRTFHTEHREHLCINSSQMLMSQNHSQRSCWNCGRSTNPARELFFCDCGVVQKPASELTYFDLMQLKPSFDIDIKSLGEMFRQTQKKLHPDKFSTKKQEERDLAQQQSSLLNKAYNTLQKPLSRAIYLLELQNIEISERDNFTDPQFLMDIMETNEKLSAAQQPSDVEAVEKANDLRIEECIKEISELYKKNLLDDMKRATIKLRYYTTIQERIFEIKRSSLG